MIKYIQFGAPRDPQNLVSRTYEQVKRDFGLLAEPLTLHTASPMVLAAVWILIRETLVVGEVRRNLKEVVATAVSESNRCPYCVDAHSMMFWSSSGHGTTHFPDHPDRLIRDVFQWGLATRDPISYAEIRFPLRESERAEVFGTALAFHYINRMVSVFLDETPLPIHSAWFKNIQQRMAALWLTRAVRRTKSPGAAFQLLTNQAEAEISPLSWLANDSSVARAIRLWGASLEECGARSLTPIARERIHQHLATWDGNDPPLGSAWLENAVTGLEGVDLIGAKLGIMTAVCPHRVTQKLIDGYRGYEKSDEDLINATAWASMRAAIRVASWW